MEKLRIAQWGTRHGHAGGKWRALCDHPQVEAVGVYESDPERRRQVELGDGPFKGARFFESSLRGLCPGPSESGRVIPA